MPDTFRRRCESAMPPATLAALAVLLVNDVGLKALWPHPWTTGKLSDLAWMVFAPPLLAYLLSFAARENPLPHESGCLAFVSNVSCITLCSSSNSWKKNKQLAPLAYTSDSLVLLPSIARYTDENRFCSNKWINSADFGSAGNFLLSLDAEFPRNYTVLSIYCS